MPNKSTAEIFSDINRAIHSINKEGETVTQDLDNVRPKYHVLTFKPLSIERYGYFRNRAPLLVGRFGVEGFFYKYTDFPELVVPYVVVDSGHDMFGCQASEEYITAMGNKLNLPYEITCT